MDATINTVDEGKNMIKRLAALHFGCLRHIDVPVGNFQILVGPNASGKSTFFDIIRFIGDFLRDGLESAVHIRTPNFSNLVWMQASSRFELAVELEIPSELQDDTGPVRHESARYEIAVGLNDQGELAILSEILWLRSQPPEEQKPARELFPSLSGPPASILLPPNQKASHRGGKSVVKKTESGNDYFRSEKSAWNIQFRLGPQRPALANLPEDEDKFPVAIWVKRLLMEELNFLLLNSVAMRKSSPPGSPKDFRPDGSNIPFAIEHLRSSNMVLFEQWVEHVRTALPDIEDIQTVERPEDKHRYLQILYATGLRAPSWTVSDGTLRLLALTLVAYLPIRHKIYLIEEPENGIHPQAIETIYQSLSSSYDNQILCASHSPLFLSLAEPEEILCFARTPDGATDVVTGSEHPKLRNWRRRADLGTLLATGVLG